MATLAGACSNNMGLSHDIATREGNHGALGHTGAIRVMVAPSRDTRKRTRSTKSTGGSAQAFSACHEVNREASATLLLSSGLAEQYRSIRRFSLVAKKSIECPYMP